MERLEILHAIYDYLGLLDGNSEPRSKIGTLAAALDRLAVGFHSAPHGKPDLSDVNPPTRDGKRLREMAAASFPQLGHYNTPMHIHERVGDTHIAVGDAINDLADIAGDLEEVLWRWQNTGEDDALWHYKSLYRIHWGRHLHDLRSYLHAVMFGA
jgi:hypothetical protein